MLVLWKTGFIGDIMLITHAYLQENEGEISHQKNKKSFLQRNCEVGHNQFANDYFADDPVYAENSDVDSE